MEQICIQNRSRNPQGQRGYGANLRTKSELKPSGTEGLRRKFAHKIEAETFRARGDTAQICARIAAEVFRDRGDTIKSRFVELVLLTSAVKARPSSNRASWEQFHRCLAPKLKNHQCESSGIGFCRFLEPMLENPQIEPRGIRFVAFCSQS